MAIVYDRVIGVIAARTLTLSRLELRISMEDGASF